MCSHLHCRDGSVSLGPPPVTFAEDDRPSTSASDWCRAGYQRAEGDRKQLLRTTTGYEDWRDIEGSGILPLFQLQRSRYCCVCVESGTRYVSTSNLKRRSVTPLPLVGNTAGGMQMSTFRRLEECFETASSGVSLYLDMFNLLPSSTCVPLVVTRGWVHPSPTRVVMGPGHVVEPSRGHHGAGADPHHTA